MKISIVYFTLLILSACSDSNETSISISPASPESIASEKFYNSNVYKEYKKNGFILSCERICLQITDNHLNLMGKYKQDFIKFKRKLYRISLSEGKTLRFTNPVGNYEMLLPVIDTEKHMSSALSALALVLEAEALIGPKLFISTAGSEVDSAINRIKDNSDLFQDLDLTKIYLTYDNGTHYNSFTQTAVVNINTLNFSEEKAFYRLSLVKNILNKIPRLEISIASPSEKNYIFTERLLKEIQEIKDIVKNNAFSLILDLDSKFDSPTDIYVSSYSRMFKITAVGIVSEISNTHFLNLLRYESLLFDLRLELGLQIQHSDAFSDTTKLKECIRTLPTLTSYIQEKKEYIGQIEVKYNFYDQNVKSSFANKKLTLNCSEDSITDMINIIQNI